MRCDGLRVQFNPLLGEGTGPTKSIVLTIEKKKRKMAPNIKRTPFEEDNYIGSAWCRPVNFPLLEGPKCLRVLGPISCMEVTNMTQPTISPDEHTIMVEGTVNRLCLKLKAGPDEFCDDIKYKVKLSSTVTKADGTNLKLAPKELSSTEENPESSVDMKESKWRTPVLVAPDAKSTSPTATDYGYTIPSSWSVVGCGQESESFMSPKRQTLKRGESTYVFLEVYRPSPIADGKFKDICQTDFEVSIEYNQKRLPAQSSDGTEGTGDNGTFDIVVKTFTESISWTAPLMASFSRGAINSWCPSGISHPSNLTDDARPSDTSVFTNVPIIEGENIGMRGVLQLGNISGEVKFEILGVRFDVRVYFYNIVMIKYLFLHNGLFVHSFPSFFLVGVVCFFFFFPQLNKI